MPRRARDARSSSSASTSKKRATRGSAILLAVTLLVLLAVMGLAFISSARSERVVSAGATHAAQGEMLVRAALGLVESVLVNDVITEVKGERKLRPASR